MNKPAKKTEAKVDNGGLKEREIETLKNKVVDWILNGEGKIIYPSGYCSQPHPSVYDKLPISSKTQAIKLPIKKSGCEIYSQFAACPLAGNNFAHISHITLLITNTGESPRSNALPVVYLV